MQQKDQLMKKLQSHKDNKSLLDKKDKAVNGSKSNSDTGFKMPHLLIATILGILLGAYCQIHFLATPKTIVANQTES